MIDLPPLMEKLKLRAFQIRVMILAALMVASVNLVNGQVSTSCTISMMSSFTPCANIITGSTNNGLVSPSTCCDSLRSLMSSNMDCYCLVISGNAPIFQLAINQTLALSLSKACNINGAALQCNGPAGLGQTGQTPTSIASSPVSPQVSNMMDVEEAHKYEKVELAEEPSPSPSPEAPSRTRIPQIRPVLTPRPSTSHSSFVYPSPFVFLIGIMVFSIH